MKIIPKFELSIWNIPKIWNILYKASFPNVPSPKGKLHETHNLRATHLVFSGENSMEIPPSDQQLAPENGGFAVFTILSRKGFRPIFRGQLLVSGRVYVYIHIYIYIHIIHIYIFIYTYIYIYIYTYSIPNFLKHTCSYITSSSVCYTFAPKGNPGKVNRRTQTTSVYGTFRWMGN